RAEVGVTQQGRVIQGSLQQGRVTGSLQGVAGGRVHCMGSRAEDRGRCWQGRGQGSLLAGQRTGITAGRAEDRDRCWQGRGQGHCWQGRGQGSLLAGQSRGQGSLLAG
ncbi:unnamed protein product, partial [Staurois parvus]